MIETLRQIVAKRRARVILFAKPPVVENLEVVSQFHETDEDHPERLQYEKDRLLVDMQTANAIVLVYDAVTPETRAKIDRMLITKSGMLRVANIAWSAVR